MGESLIVLWLRLSLGNVSVVSVRHSVRGGVHVAIGPQCTTPSRHGISLEMLSCIENNYKWM